MKGWKLEEKRYEWMQERRQWIDKGLEDLTCVNIRKMAKKFVHTNKEGQFNETKITVSQISNMTENANKIDIYYLYSLIISHLLEWKVDTSG